MKSPLPRKSKRELHASLFVNRSSRNTRKLLRTLTRACEANGILLDTIYEIKRGSDFSALIQEVRSAKPKLLLIAAGDGTVSSVVGMLSDTQIEMAIIPFGTTNNFARSLGMPLSIDDCVRRIARVKAKPVDIGNVNGIYFTNVIGIGISGIIAGNVKDSFKRRYGAAAYGIIGLREFIRHKPFHVNITDAHGNLEVRLETHQLIVANGAFHAGRKIADEASVDSRELVVFALGGKSRVSFFFHMLDFYSGRRRSIRHSAYYTGKNIRIETSRVQRVDVDGELRIKTPLKMRVEPAAIQVRY